MTDERVAICASCGRTGGTAPPVSCELPRWHDDTTAAPAHGLEPPPAPVVTTHSADLLEQLLQAHRTIGVLHHQLEAALALVETATADRDRTVEAVGRLGDIGAWEAHGVRVLAAAVRQHGGQLTLSPDELEQAPELETFVRPSDLALVIRTAK